MAKKKNYVLKAETGYLGLELQEGEELIEVADVWRRMALDLARVVNKHRKERLVEDKERAWAMAQEMLRIEKLENKKV